MGGAGPCFYWSSQREKKSCVIGHKRMMADGASKKLTLSKKLGLMIRLSRQMPTPSNGFRLEDATKMV